MKIIIPPGTKVCFEPETGKETVLKEPFVAGDAEWGVNRLPGWVFNFCNGKPTAYTIDWKNIVEDHD